MDVAVKLVIFERKYAGKKELISIEGWLAEQSLRRLLMPEEPSKKEIASFLDTMVNLESPSVEKLKSKSHTILRLKPELEIQMKCNQLQGEKGNGQN